MTTANKITLTRIAMIPFFIYFAAQPMRIIDELRYLVVFPTSCSASRRLPTFWTATSPESTIR